MKKLIISLSILPFLFFGCKNKKDDPIPGTNDSKTVNKSKTELLTQHSWKLVSSTADRAVDTNEDGTASTNIMAQRPTCENDDVITFTNSEGSPKTGSKDQGPTKCSTLDPQTRSFTWNWNDTQTVLETTAFLVLSKEYSVLELNDDLLRVSYGAKDKNDGSYIVTEVYTKP